MSIGDTHASEPHIDTHLVRRLLESQHPQWANLPIVGITSDSTDNAIFRIGDDMCVRLPRLARAAGQVRKEQSWLPRLGMLPLDVPVPLANGDAIDAYPWNWSVYRWVEGEIATPDRISNMGEAAVALAEFVAGLHRVDTLDGPLSGAHNENRGANLALRDAATRKSIEALCDEIDVPAVTAIWETSLDASVWSGPPVWIHGDIHSGNLIARNGNLCAVIDFGLMGVGDPACDMMVGWNLLSAGPREIFRRHAAVDAATWVRGRGWALSVALVALAYYRSRNTDMTERSRYTIQQILSDAARE